MAGSARPGVNEAVHLIFRAKERQMIGSTKTRGQRGAARVLFAAGLGILALVGSAAVTAADEPAPTVPANLQVPAGNRAYLTTHATGTQNYICLGAGLPWTFLGPQATVFNDEGEQALHHYLSPNPVEGGIARATWRHSADTSTVWALAVASSTDPDYVAPGSVAWLLLQVVGTESGPHHGDRMVRTTFIHRVNTLGGIAPAGACPGVGARAFVPYETDYVFYRAR
jgi:hypothetical protein